MVGTEVLPPIGTHILGTEVPPLIMVTADTATAVVGTDDMDENQPLDLSWPDSCRERITYILFLPIILPLWLTLPDTRKQSGIPW